MKLTQSLLLSASIVTATAAAGASALDGLRVSTPAMGADVVHDANGYAVAQRWAVTGQATTIHIDGFAPAGNSTCGGIAGVIALPPGATDVSIPSFAPWTSFFFPNDAILWATVETPTGRQLAWSVHTTGSANICQGWSNLNVMALPPGVSPISAPSVVAVNGTQYIYFVGSDWWIWELIDTPWGPSNWTHVPNTYEGAALGQIPTAVYRRSAGVISLVWPDSSFQNVWALDRHMDTGIWESGGWWIPFTALVPGAHADVACTGFENGPSATTYLVCGDSSSRNVYWFQWGALPMAWHNVGTYHPWEAPLNLLQTACTSGNMDPDCGPGRFVTGGAFREGLGPAGLRLSMLVRNPPGVMPPYDFANWLDPISTY